MREHKKKILKRLLIIAGAFILVSFLFLLYVIKTLPNPAELGEYKVNQTTKIYDRTSQVLLYEIYGEENRTVLAWDQIPEAVKLTTLAAEDANFYKHKAVDFKGILRAIAYNILHPTQLQGASTISQQLARNAFLTKEKSIWRKFRELILAIKIERIYTKDKIFELYLNQVPYGSSAYGIESAAKLYFKKSATELDLAEAAYLAALLQSPTYLSPYGSHTDELDNRQKWILNRLITLNLVPKEEVEKAQQEKVKFAPPTFGMQAPHFVMYIKDMLALKYGEDFDSLGLKVTTTLDANLQKIAETAVTKYSKQNTETMNANNMGLLAQDPQTGQILAMVGSHDYYDLENEGNYNVTLAQRQPGSSFKPFAYITALKKGYTPQTVIYDLPTNFSDDPANPYKPKNYDLKFRGPVTFKQALAQSINVPAVEVLYLAGIKNAIQTATNFGITTLTKPPEYYGLSLVLGGGAVKLIDMVGAYSVFSQEGVLHPQASILKIEDPKGKVLEEYKDQPSNVIEPQYTQMINDMLSDDNARAPLFGYNSALAIPGYQVAAKTGTSQDYRDAWIIGYTPTLVAGVWAGNNDYTPINKGGAGGMVAAPCWHEFMAEALKIIGSRNFNPAPVVTSNKPMLDGNYLVQRVFKIDRSTGLPATPSTPTINIGEVTFKEIHSLLYYVDKNDPTGRIPTNPGQDPQFNNWESPVINWARTSIPNFDAEYNKPIPAQYLTAESTITQVLPQNLISIDFVSPNDGQTINGDFYTEATIKGASDANIYLNNVPLGPMTKNQAGNFVYYINYSQLTDQNIIKIEALSASQVLGQAQITVTK